MKTRSLKARSVVLFGLLVLSSVAAFAQEPAKPKPEDRVPALTPLRVQVVFSEFDGDKKISSLPYSFTVNADERRARPGSQLRNGARVPVATTKDSYTYMDIGTNVDCSASQQEDGRFKLQMSVERSSILPEGQSAAGSPSVRQFRAEINPVLKDGQSLEAIVSTDPLSGHTYHISVTLNVIK